MTIAEKIRALLLGTRAATKPPVFRPRRLQTARLGVSERCAGCQAPMIAGSGYLHARLLCGRCRSHDLGAPMPPRTADTADDEGPRAA